MVKLDGDDVKIADKDIVHFTRYNTIVKNDKETDSVID
eukprot:CAMPEP_0116880160 /NCGR_PEP_ID=MMETSP0463-20121206/12057_1 /TAXON_ID=181622 /ORGANISM="Strombidinopsis sp, Strain SopsisLIS2011" /LENGTH=37 /DNA_ID= /DNA_START= /DNA_END= /DNA_ORIENTATION=